MAVINDAPDDWSRFPGKKPNEPQQLVACRESQLLADVFSLVVVAAVVVLVVLVVVVVVAQHETLVLFFDFFKKKMFFEHLQRNRHRCYLGSLELLHKQQLSSFFSFCQVFCCLASCFSCCFRFFFAGFSRVVRSIPSREVTR